MNRILPALAIAAAAALALAGCGTTEAASGGASGSAAAISVTDATGTKVKLDGPAERVVGTEWNVVEMLVSLGVQPVGVADVKGYTAWDQSAKLTGDPKDIGTRGEPSVDTIAALKPDLIVATSDLQASAVKQLRRIAPVLEVTSANGKDQIGQVFDDVDMIATATGTTTKAKSLRTSFDATVAEGKKDLAAAGADGAPVAFADGWLDANQVGIRPYTATSLLGAVNSELGLENAWTVKGDAAYGLGSTDVEGMTKLPEDVRFMYISNSADGDDVFAKTLPDNAVWKSLGFVQADQVHRLPDGIWMFGGPASMEAYVNAVVDALTK
jgi:ferric hydroxamate transport system substrate-binding protein